MSDTTPNAPAAQTISTTPQPLRRFNEAGVARFRQFLAELRQDATLAPPMDLLIDPAIAELVPGTTPVSRPPTGLSTKRQVAELLRDLLAPLRAAGRDVSRDVGLWSWLTLFFFADVCPPGNGRRKTLADPHYIPDIVDYRRSYRHLLATPYRVLLLAPVHNRLLLNYPVHIHGDIMEQMMGRLFIMRLPAVQEVLDLLYYDKETERPKRGIVGKSPRAGDLRNRLTTRIRQLQRTHDLAALDGRKLIPLLGSEFRGWVDADEVPQAAA